MSHYIYRLFINFLLIHYFIYRLVRWSDPQYTLTCLQHKSRVFLSDGHVPMDNNYAEQVIRPFTIDHKNFVLIESSNGAKASAILYSLVETAKANIINTFEYFNLLLTEIPQHMEDKDLSFIDNLLPWSSRVQKEFLVFFYLFISR